MAWRLARSLVVLRSEVRTLKPGTTVWDIGDEDHADEASDHNPNVADVVCATDTLPDAGLDLGWYAEKVRRSGHPAVKYVIYNRRIWSKTRANEGWRQYFGKNPHTGHVHVSVGIGSDGRSTGPYDDTSPWGLLTKEDELSWTQKLQVSQWIKDAFGDSWGDDGATAGGLLVSDYGHSRSANAKADRILAGQQAILAAVAGDDVVASVKAELAKHDKAMADRLAGLGPVLAAALADQVPELTAEQLAAPVEAALRRVFGAVDEV